MAGSTELKQMTGGTSRGSTLAADTEQDRTNVFQCMFDLEGCMGYMPGGLPCILRQPNVSCEEAASICVAINGSQGSCAIKCGFGHMVPPGSIGLLDHNGKIEAVPDGRYILGLYRARWVGIRSLTMAEPIVQGFLTIVRVPRGKMGMATEKGNAILLDAGLHVYNDVTFKFERLLELNSDYIHHGPLHVIRVRRGEYAKVWISGQSGAMEPKLLKEGCHVVDSGLFFLSGRANMSDEHVSHGSLHILQVPKGCVAKVTRDNLYYLLGEGSHHMESTNFQFGGIASWSDALISHGTITVVRVNRGQFGIAWQDNQPLFLEEPGLYQFDSPNFQFERHASITDKIIELGTKKVVNVYAGEVGLSYEKGQLRILNPGQHIIDDAAHVVDGFLSTQQRNVRLKAVEGSRDTRKSPGKDDDLLICETRDLVKVGLRADVFYAIENPDKTIRCVAKDEIELLVLETAIATLTNIIRSTTLNEIAQSKHPSAISSDAHVEDLKTSQALTDCPSAPLFFDKAHDEFLSKLHDDFIKRYGIDITNIRIESFKIMDEELAGNISKQALTTAQTESQLANLAGQTEIATKEQERLASVRQIQTQAEADSLRTQAEAQNAALLSSADAKAKAEQVATETAARAEAAAIVERARGEAQAISIRAQAEAEAIELKAAAEAKRAQLLAATPLGAQLSLLSVYADMATKSNEGVEKVVYCDMQAGGNLGLFGMPSLQSLSKDLAQLQGIGGTLDAKPDSKASEKTV